LRRPLTAQRLSSTRISKRTSVRPTRRRPTTTTGNIALALIEEITEQESLNHDNVDERERSHPESSSTESAVVEVIRENEAAERILSDTSSPIHTSSRSRSTRTRRRPRSTPSHSISSTTAEQILHQQSTTSAAEQEGQSSFAISNSMTPIIVEDLPDSGRPQPRVMEKPRRTRISKRTLPKRTRRHRTAASSNNMTPEKPQQILDTESSNQGVHEETDVSVVISPSTVPIAVIDRPDMTRSHQSSFPNLNPKLPSPVHFQPVSDGDPASTNTNRISASTVEQMIEDELTRYLDEEAAIPGGEDSGSTRLPPIADLSNMEDTRGGELEMANAEGIPAQTQEYQHIQIARTPVFETTVGGQPQLSEAQETISCSRDGQTVGIDVNENTRYVELIF